MGIVLSVYVFEAVEAFTFDFEQVMSDCIINKYQALTKTAMFSLLK